MKGKLLHIVVAAMVVAACASPMYVHKDAFDQTKRIAVVSVQSNRTLVPIGSGGGGLTALASIGSKLFGKKSEQKQGSGPDEGWMGQLVSYGHDSFARSQTGAYVRFANDYKGSSGESLLRVAAPHMPSGAIDVRQESVRKNLVQLCKDLGVDGVAVVELDLGYETSTGVGSIGGGATGTAQASVKATLGVLGANGEWILDPHSARSQVRQKSSSTVPMVLGNIAPDAKSMAMFKEGIDNAASAYKTEILAALN
jgi:hypothetical protein